jgi:hypothetical protein
MKQKCLHSFSTAKQTRLGDNRYVPHTCHTEESVHRRLTVLSGSVLTDNTYKRTGRTVEMSSRSSSRSRYNRRLLFGAQPGIDPRKHTEMIGPTHVTAPYRIVPNSTRQTRLQHRSRDTSSRDYIWPVHLPSTGPNSAPTGLCTFLVRGQTRLHLACAPSWHGAQLSDNFATAIHPDRLDICLGGKFK